MFASRILAFLVQILQKTQSLLHLYMLKNVSLSAIELQRFTRHGPTTIKLCSSNIIGTLSVSASVYHIQSYANEVLGYPFLNTLKGRCICFVFASLCAMPVLRLQSWSLSHPSYESQIRTICRRNKMVWDIIKPEIVVKSNPRLSIHIIWYKRQQKLTFTIHFFLWVYTVSLH